MNTQNQLTATAEATLDITISTGTDGRQFVDARALHTALDVKTPFHDWIVRYIETAGLEDGLDFSAFLRESNGGRRRKDYTLTLDSAKSISMLQRSDKGKRVRRYFIECEKALQTRVKPLSTLDMLKTAVLELERVEADKLQLQADKQLLLAQQATDAPKVEFAETVLLNEDSVTVNEACSLAGLPWKAVTMNRIWEDLRVIFRNSKDAPVPYAPFLAKEYFVAKEVPVRNRNTGEVKIRVHYRVTQKGIGWMVGMASTLRSVNVKSNY